MEVLSKLFGSSARLKIMRLFLLNPQDIFESSDVRVKSQVSARLAHRELMSLASIQLIKSKVSSKKVSTKKGKKIVIRKKKFRGWTLNEDFFYLDALKTLIVSSRSFDRVSITKRFKNAGRIKVLIVSGLFIQGSESRIDIFIVGDDLKRSSISRALTSIESEIGKELRYGIFTTKDFLYRLDMYDKFIRDIIDYPHEKLIDKLGIDSRK